MLLTKVELKKDQTLLKEEEATEEVTDVDFEEVEDKK
jgi:hypothetical protein